MKTKRVLKTDAARRILGYCRVSTEDQSREGFSLETQEERIRAYATATGRVLDEVVIDAGESAKSLERDGLQRVLADVRHGTVEAIVILKLDRLTRSVRDLGELLELFERTGTAVVSVSESLDTSSAAGRLMLNLLASVSQWERETIGERTATVLASRRSKRKVYAHAAFGWRREGKELIPEPNEQRAIAMMREMRACGKTLQAIADWLQTNEYAPRQGGTKWYPQSVKHVLESRIATEAA